LEGYVIDVGGPDDDPLKDKVKVRINFDDPTPPEEAAWLPYATYYSAENHTGFYCLPELGDYVKIRFSSTNEDKAVVVSSTRLERDREKLVDHLNTKMFRTNHRKELALTQTGVTLSGKEKNLLIRLDQEKGVTIFSHNQLEIRSKGNLNLQAGRKVSITAKRAVDIKCGQKSRLVLNENETSGMIHIFGSKVKKEQGKEIPNGSRAVISNKEKKMEMCKYANSELGILSKKYESNGEPGTISGGGGDIGGASYGAYQFASKYDVPYSFVKWLKSKNERLFKKLNEAYVKDGNKYGSNFNNAWKLIAKENRALFLKYQYDYVKINYYDVAVNQGV
jgi:hypothetical protein